MVHRDSCLSIGGFQVGESRGEDIDLWIRMALRFPVATSDHVGCFYRRVAGSLTGVHEVDQPDVAMRTIMSLLMDKNISQSRKQNLEDLYSRMALAHAADNLMLGRQSVAKLFIQEASRSRLYARRYRALLLLSYFPKLLFRIAIKIRSLINAK